MSYSFEELEGRGVPKSNDFVGMSVGMSFDSRCGGRRARRDWQCRQSNYWAQCLWGAVGLGGHWERIVLLPNVESLSNRIGDNRGYD